MLEHMREQQALVDLRAVLVLLHAGGLRGDLRARGREAGHQRGRRVGEVVNAQRARHAVGQPVVERRRMRAQKPLAQGAGIREQRRRLRRLRGVALRLRRQPGECGGGRRPLTPACVGIRLERAGER